SIGAAYGMGAWGHRGSTQGRVYPWSIERLGLFLELGGSLNLGKELEAYVDDGPPLSGHTTRQRSRLLPIPTVNLAVGWRISGDGHRGWLSIRVGYCA